jgi:hypothetical protein
LNAGPNFQIAYVNLVAALRETTRQHEALTLLERALSQWPDFELDGQASLRIARDAALSEIPDRRPLAAYKAP